jgi:hypothetical protein
VELYLHSPSSRLCVDRDCFTFYLHGVNELYVDGLLELRWIVGLREVRTRASVSPKDDRVRDSER